MKSLNLKQSMIDVIDEISNSYPFSPFSKLLGLVVFDLLMIGQSKPVKIVCLRSRRLPPSLPLLYVDWALASHLLSAFHLSLNAAYSLFVSIY